MTATEERRLPVATPRVPAKEGAETHAGKGPRVNGTKWETQYTFFKRLLDQNPPGHRPQTSGSFGLIEPGIPRIARDFNYPDGELIWLCSLTCQARSLTLVSLVDLVGVPLPSNIVFRE